MKRRDFVRLAGTGMSVGALAEAAVSAQIARTPAAAASTSPKALMKVGTQHGHTDPILRACAAFGVNNICSGLPSEKMDEAWSVDGLSKLKETVASHGISLDMVPLPMSSYEISRAEMPAIFLGKSPDRAATDPGEGVQLYLWDRRPLTSPQRGEGRKISKCACGCE